MLSTALVAVMLLCSGALAQIAPGVVCSASATSNQFRLGLSGQTGALYRVEVSTNLANWSRLALAINQTGALSFEVPLIPGSGHAFYRAVADGPAHQVAESYSAKTGVFSTAAKLALFQFADGLQDLGLLTNLADFAFFCEGMQPANGEPVSWRNTGTVLGSINRLRGGFELPNFLTTNSFLFTNLPPTPDGRTLVLWGAGNMNPCGVSQDTGVAIVELTSDGAWPQRIEQMFFSNGGYSGLNLNGSFQRIGPSWYPYSGYENSFFCLGLSSSAAGYEFCLKRDKDTAEFSWSGSDNTSASPTVIRFGFRSQGQPQSAWNGIYRGFAYFKTTLTRDQIMAINALVPRVGLILEGDSKTDSYSPSIYWRWWMNSKDAWGLYALRTNSAVAGTRVAAANSPLGDSMEDRFAADSLLTTNSQYPLVLYSLRGGVNDFVATNQATRVRIDNAFTAITNLWAKASARGFRVVGWTVDRTGVSWSGGTPGNSNLLVSLNSRLRENRSMCDFFVDNELWYVSNYGETPFANYSLYIDGIHDWPAGPLIGTNELGPIASPSLGFEVR